MPPASRNSAVHQPATISADPPPALPFEDGADSKIFRFRYEGPPRGLLEYLLGRYAHGRDEAWRRGFYPRRVRLDGREVDGGTQVQAGQEVAYLHLRAEEPAPPDSGAPLYEDEWYVALYKPDSIPVNPAGIYYFTCLAVLARERLGLPRLAPVHRLDLETAGPLLMAKSKEAARRFQQLFQRKAVGKTYRALVHGAFPAGTREIAGRIEPDGSSAIKTKLRLVPWTASEGEGAGGAGNEAGARTAEKEGRASLTRVLAVRHLAPYSELLLEPVTGQTNQLRVHLAALGHPIVGDKKYHPDEGVFLDWHTHRDFGRLREKLVLPRQALLCEVLEFAHPFSGAPVRVEAPRGSWAAKLAGLPISRNGEGCAPR